ncbi:MAG TPA: AEC family transporter [Cellvibrionaceae bacterium]
MVQFAIIVVCLFAGLLLQWSRLAGERTAKQLNAYVITIALPCLILHELPGLSLDHTAFLPIIIAWLVMAVSILAVLGLQKVFNWSRDITACLMLLMPLGNTGFVGIPLIKVLLGTEGVPYAILYDQFGTFLALNTIGIAIAASYSGNGQSIGSIGKKIITFPPFISLLVAFALLPFTYPSWLDAGLGLVAASLVPVVMLAVGLNWRLQLEAHLLQPFMVGLVLLLIAKPAFAWLLLSMITAPGLATQVIVLEAGMPVMISAGILAISYNLAPRLAAALVGYSLLAAFITLPLWRWLVS